MKPDFDFIIIGSGVLGCLAYDHISSRNGKVLLISEGNTYDDENPVIQTGPKKYSGILSGRKKGLGGTSQLWGGAMNINFEKTFIEQCQTELINFDDEKKRIFDFFGIRNVNTKPKQKVYSSKKYNIYEEEIVWPSFAKRNVYKNLKKKYQSQLKLKIGSYKKVEKIGKIYHLFIKMGPNKTEIFTCKKVIFCMGFIDNIGENLKEKENFQFKEHLSSPIGIISNTENFPLSSSLAYNFNHFKTKRYEIFDNKKRKSVGFIHLSNVKSDFLIKFRDLLICLQSFKTPPLRLIYDIIKLSYQIFPIIKSMIINKGGISNNKSKSHIHLVIDKVQCAYITKSNNQLKINWDISDVDIKVFKNLKLEMNKIIRSLIYISPSPKKSYVSSKTIEPKEIFHPFSGLRKKKCTNSEYIWVGTHALQELGSLSPTLASHFLKMKEYENARKNMCDYTNKK
ncbi:hypothetical protein PQZ43_03310 [Alphaproteobacteria bacterium]|nr:hypothetical protein [Alphaproteobacteria bacterium]